jgi:hypothetical protein
MSASPPRAGTDAAAPRIRRATPAPPAHSPRAYQETPSPPAASRRRASRAPISVPGGCQVEAPASSAAKMRATCDTGLLLHVHGKLQGGVHRPDILHHFPVAAVGHRLERPDRVPQHLHRGLEDLLRAGHQRLGTFQRHFQIVAGGSSSPRQRIPVVHVGHRPLPRPEAFWPVHKRCGKKKRPSGPVLPRGHSPTSSSLPKEVPWTARRVNKVFCFQWVNRRHLRSRRVNPQPWPRPPAGSAFSSPTPRARLRSVASARHFRYVLQAFPRRHARPSHPPRRRCRASCRGSPPPRSRRAPGWRSASAAARRSRRCSTDCRPKLDCRMPRPRTPRPFVTP